MLVFKIFSIIILPISEKVAFKKSRYKKEFANFLRSLYVFWKNIFDIVYGLFYNVFVIEIYKKKTISYRECCFRISWDTKSSNAWWMKNHNYNHKMVHFTAMVGTVAADLQAFTIISKKIVSQAIWMAQNTIRMIRKKSPLTWR